jgi:hypothetical protein
MHRRRNQKYLEILTAGTHKNEFGKPIRAFADGSHIEALEKMRKNGLHQRSELLKANIGSFSPQDSRMDQRNHFSSVDRIV